MSKGLKIAIAIVVVCAVALVIIMSTVSWNILNLFGINEEFEMKTAQFSNVESDFSIMDTDVDIVVKPSQDGDIHVTYYENDNVKYEITDESGISFEKLPYTSAGGSAPHIELLLPANYSGSLNLKTVDEDISVDSVYADEIVLHTENSDIMLKNVTSTASAHITALNTKVTVTDSNFEGKLHAETENEDVEIINVTASGVYAGTENSDIDVNNVTAGDIDIAGDNSDINIGNSVGDLMELHTINGDIKGNISAPESDFTYTTTTKNGDNNMGAKVSENATRMLNATTENGDIELKFE